MDAYITPQKAIIQPVVTAPSAAAAAVSTAPVQQQPQEPVIDLVDDSVIVAEEEEEEEESWVGEPAEEDEEDEFVGAAPPKAKRKARSSSSSSSAPAAVVTSTTLKLHSQQADTAAAAAATTAEAPAFFAPRKRRMSKATRELRVAELKKTEEEIFAKGFAAWKAEPNLETFKTALLALLELKDMEKEQVTIEADALNTKGVQKKAHSLRAKLRAALNKQLVFIKTGSQTISAEIPTEEIVFRALIGPSLQTTPNHVYDISVDPEELFAELSSKSPHKGLRYGGTLKLTGNVRLVFNNGLLKASTSYGINSFW